MKKVPVKTPSAYFQICRGSCFSIWSLIIFILSFRTLALHSLRNLFFCDFISVNRHTRILPQPLIIKCLLFNVIKLKSLMQKNSSLLTLKISRKL